MIEPKDKPRYMIDTNEQDSKEIQRLLFSLGYKWLFYGTKVSYTNSCRFFANSDGYLAHSDEYYPSDWHKYLTLQELRNLVKKEGEKMSDYKIKVANEAESKEAQELLFELGYSWGEEGKILVDIEGNHFIANYLNTSHLFYSSNVYIDVEKNKQITLPQLRDLVILHRNDVGDATHKCKNNDEKWFLTSDTKLYYFHIASGEWQLHSATETEVILKDYAAPITQEKQMTWQDALRAVADGKEVEFLHDKQGWISCLGLNIDQVIGNLFQFRLTPQRKELNGNFTKEELLKIAGEMV